MDRQQLETLLSQGLDAYQSGDFPKALKKFEKILRATPDDHAVRKAAAYTANKTAAWKSAATHWLEISKLNPRRAGPVDQYISALLNAGNFKVARSYCNTSEFMQAKANAQRYYTVMLTVSLSEGKLGEAKELAAKGYALAKKDSVALDYASLFFDHKNGVEMDLWLQKVKDPKKHRDAIAFLKARALYAQKLWKESAQAWKNLLQSQTKRYATSACVFLARIASNSGDKETARSYFELVLQDTPRHEEAITFFIRGRMADQDYAGAQTLIDEHWAVLNPIRRISFMARCLSASDPQTGLQFYAEALESQPENFPLRLGYIGFLLDMKNVGRAEATIQDSLSEQPDHEQLNRLILRLMQLKLSPVDQQLKQAEFTLALAPTDVSLLNTVGGLLAQNNRRGDAVSHYKASVKVGSNEAILWRNGTYYMAMDNRLEDAAAFADEAIRILGKSSATELTNAAWIMMAAQKLGPALKFANKAIKLDPESTTALEMAADLQMLEGRYDRAWRHIQKIDSLVFPRRSEKIAHLGAQCAAAFRAMSDNGSQIVQPVKGLFPELLFHAIVKRATPDPENREGIVQFSSSLGAGGAERQVAYVMQGLMQDKRSMDACRLVVNSLNPETGNNFFLQDVVKTGADITDLEALRLASGIRQILADHPEHAATIRLLASLPHDASRIAIPFFGYLVRTRPRVVHLWQDTINIAGGIAAVAAGVPQIVLCTRSTRPIEISRFRRYLAEGYMALLNYSGALTIVNNSANGARDYEGWLGIETGSILTFYNGYDFKSIRDKVKRSDRGKIRKIHAIPTTAKVIGGVMRFSPEKRPDLWVNTLIAAIAQSDTIHGLIVGDGPMLTALMEQVAAVGLSSRIHFVGRQTPVEPWMSAMDMLFLSSVTEGLPNVLIEAQSLGVPVATMDIGGAPEALSQGESGLTLQEVTPEELAAQIVEASNDKARMKAMSKAAIAFVNTQFSLKTMVNTLKRFYTPSA